MERGDLMRYTVTVIMLLNIISLLTSVNAQMVMVDIETDKSNVSPGETFSANIIIDPVEKGISAVDLTLSFNPEILEALSITKGRLLGENVIELFSEINNTIGNIRYVAARVGPTTPPTPKESLIVITFRVKQNVKPINTTLTIINIGIADEIYADVEGVIIKNATIAITSATTKTETTLPTTITIATTTFTSYFPATTRLIQTVTEIAEGKNVVNLAFLSLIFAIIASVTIISVFLLISLKRRRRKPIVISVR